jgi:hypothetical protein
MLTVTNGVASIILRTGGVLLLYGKLRSIWLTWNISLALFSSKMGIFGRFLIMSKSASRSVVMASFVGPGTTGQPSYAFLEPADAGIAQSWGDRRHALSASDCSGPSQVESLAKAVLPDVVYFDIDIAPTGSVRKSCKHKALALPLELEPGWLRKTFIPYIPTNLVRVSHLRGSVKSLGENVSGLVVGPNVADVNPLGSTNFRKPIQVDPVGPSKVG